eukprot:CAMPEP_0185603994 /NCGR_PEP_ID=MMETSP0436-20130131/2960_1 /TAXON_ID=626734 ORGANISM="Favella taraikaensis, Strain Fe Narragansett Bay" /NCGR_SAMPLE_ID=MMETSP0436 /ASSEMBLY_ACC=CAM_ASM_000390 /LENGTH=145 /DNA_ID=CAMNT_0028234701 /DNA_START=351 /DNA_END=789 /DNA_ORIENTATION=+
MTCPNPKGTRQRRSSHRWRSRDLSGELLSELLDEGLAHERRLVVLLELVALRLGAVAANRAHIDHSVAELNESATLDRNVEICDVVKAEVDESLQVVFTQVQVEALLFNSLALFVGVEAVLSEAIVGAFCDGWRHLLPDFDEVAA